MQLSTLQAEIGRLLNDPFNSRWTTDVLTARINLAQTEIVGYTGCVKSRTLLTPTAGAETIAVPSNPINIVRAYKTKSDGSVVPFTGINPQELDFRYPNHFQWTQGEPLFWWYDASGTGSQLHLAPIPDSANAITNGIQIWQVVAPADLVNSTDIPFDSVTAMIPYHMSIVHWVVAQCWMDDGTPEALGKSKFHKSGSMLNPGEYEKQLGRIMAEFDVEESIQSQILWQPQGGRIGGYFVPSKGYPFI